MKHFLLLLALFINNTFSPCDKVYNPHRLLLLDPQKTVVGFVNRVYFELDGDVHIRLKVTDFKLLTRRNIKDEDSCLIVEIVCVKKTYSVVVETIQIRF